jgi:predicted RNA-binding Zn-ribbon protein involved in translation (DUF1610 family)
MERGYWIKSKPEYNTLSWRDKALGHLLIAQGEGGLALVKLFQQRCPVEPLTVLFAGDDTTSKKYADILTEFVPEGLNVFDSEEVMLSELKAPLSVCLMGTQFYVAGDEAFIWKVMAELAVYGVQECNVEKELCGTLARSVYCVHCKTTDSGVHNNIHQCSGCGRNIFVRDHFSRQHGAYMGVMIDAEVPGDIPVIQEIYP